jgi:hypothetical protein
MLAFDVPVPELLTLFIILPLILLLYVYLPYRLIRFLRHRMRRKRAK